MSKSLKQLIIVALVSFSGLYSTATFAAWTEPKKVVQIQIASNTSVYVWLGGPIGYPGCIGASFIRLIRLPYTPPSENEIDNFEETYALLLMAKAQDLDVRINHSYGSCGGNNTHILNPYIAVR